MRDIRGEIGVTVTPFINGEKPNYEEVKKQVEELCNTDIDGIFPCSSTGEYPKLSFDDKIKMMEVVKEVNKGRKFLIAGACAVSLNEIKAYTEESTHEIGITSFCCFRAFLRGQQARNPWVDTDKLIADFCANYYGEAGDIMLDYFYNIQENWERIYMLRNSEHFDIFDPIKLNNFWTRDIILDFQQQLLSAMKVVEINDTDNVSIIKERIYREYLLWLINEYEFFASYYSPEEKEALNFEIEAGRAKYNIYR